MYERIRRLLWRVNLAREGERQTRWGKSYLLLYSPLSTQLLFFYPFNPHLINPLLLIMYSVPITSQCIQVKTPPSILCFHILHRQAVVHNNTRYILCIIHAKIDTVYLQHVSPKTSAAAIPPKSSLRRTATQNTKPTFPLILFS